MKERYADNTAKGYQSAINGFKKFAKLHDLSPSILAHTSLSAQPVWICYILHVKTSILQDSARKYLSAFRSVARSYGVDLPFPSMTVLEAVMKSWKRASSRTARKKVPITANQLSTLIDEAKSSNNRKSRIFTALAVFGFNTLCRVKEACELTWGQLHKSITRASFRCRLTKTDPFGVEGQILSLSIDAWQTVAGLLPTSSTSLSARIFRVEPAAFRSWIAAKLSNGITGHSLRRGGAQALYDNGYSVEEICAKGRWKSRAWLRYIDLSSRHVLL